MKNINQVQIQHKIVQGDCLEKMQKIPTNSIDFICSDFPYNISNDNGLTMKGNKIVKADFGEWDKWDNQSDYLNFVFSICKEYQRILKPQGSLVLFFSYRYAGWIGYELERKGLFTLRMPLIFEKLNPLPSFKKNNFRSSYEMGIWLVNDEGKFRRPKKFNFMEQKQMKNCMSYYIGKEGGKQTQHPTEKPENLISQLIKIFTQVGDIVLDSFAGGGTTGVAAYKLKRHCISIEKEHGFIQMIQERQARIKRE